MSASILPVGFNAITAGNFQGDQIAEFGFKATPVTNQEFGEVGRNQFVLLDHDWKTGETQLKKSGKSIEAVLASPAFDPRLCTIQREFDQGDVCLLGSDIYLK